MLALWSHRFDHFTLVTQNIDGLHERAGTRGVIRFHGSIWELRCTQACKQAPERWWDDRGPFPDMPPRCPYCGELVRPGVVWFKEGLETDVLQRSVAATACDIFMIVGTSALVYPAAGLFEQAKR